MDSILFFHTSMRQSWRKIIAGTYRFAKARRWRVQVVEPGDEPPDVAALLAFWNPLGCIVECSGRPNGYFDPAAFASIPTVFLGCDPRLLPESASCINPAPEGVGETAAREFLKAGLENFAFVAAFADQFWSRDREAVFIRALRLNGYKCHTFGRREDCSSGAKRSAALAAWIKALPKPCGVMSENDYTAVEVIDTARRMRIPVPGALSVIGVDNDPGLCENTQPRLSSIVMDLENAGYRASQILDSLVTDSGRPPVRETYSMFGLVRRGSTPIGIGYPPRVQEAVAFIRERACDGITAADVAARLSCSRRLVEMEFRKATGRTVLEEIHGVRFEAVELLLKNGTNRLNTIAGMCGWKSDNALRTAFLKRYGMSMREWRRRNAKRATAYSTAP